MRKAWATSVLTLTIITVALLSNVGSVSAVVFGNATRIYPNQIFAIYGLSSSSKPFSRLYNGTGCVSSNLLQTQPPIINIPPVYVAEFGGEPAGSYSVQVDGDLSIPTGCVPFTILPLPTTTVTVTSTITNTITAATTVTVFTSSVVEYPYGLPILAILMIIGYAVMRRKTATKPLTSP
ncbi:MAG: hypothetical protein ABSF63_14075 [Candidatus Bathyarchaeia archaeon]